MKRAQVKKRDRAGELHLRPPQDVLEAIRDKAAAESRTINAQALIWIRKGMEAEKAA